MIVPVKRVNLVLLPEDKNNVFLALQKEELFMIKGFNVENHALFNSDQLVKTKKVIKILESENKKKKLFSTLVVDYQTLDSVRDDEEKMVDDIINLENKKAETLEKIQRLQDQINLFSPFVFLTISQERLQESTLLKFKAYKMSLDKKETITTALTNLGVEFEIGEVNKEIYIVFATVGDEQQDLTIALHSVNAEEVVLPTSNLKYKDAIDLNHQKVAELKKENELIENKIKEYIEALPLIKVYYDKEVNRLVREHVPFKQSEHFIVLEGYARQDQLGRLEDILKTQTQTYEIEIVDDGGEMLPTALKNNKFVKPFESITNSFSVPNNTEKDPNPVMSIWYWIFFGMMVGDIGYGLVLLIGTLLFQKFLKPRGGIKDLVKVFFFSSFSTIVFGILTGSVFGVGLSEIIPSIPNIFISPQNDPIVILGISLVLGALHIVTGLVYKAYYMFRDGDVLGALAEAVSWIMILLALIVFAADMLGIIWPSNQIVSYISLGFIGLGLVFIIFFSGRGSKNPFGWALKAFGGLYGVTGYLSDILSYSRLLALMLSGGVIAFTMNSLAAMVANSIPVIGLVFGALVILVGHVFNFVMGLLSAYVHGGRLQYLEFYGKFFQGGGYAFKPLAYQLNYINEIKEN